MKITKKKRTLLICGLIAAVVGVSVAFAALSTNLTINGEVEVLSWKVGFGVTPEEGNPVIATMDKAVVGARNSGGTTTVPNGTILGATGNALQFKLPARETDDTNYGDGTVALLLQPGESITYTFKVVNEGSKTAYLPSANGITISDVNHINYHEGDVQFKENELTVDVIIGDDTIAASNYKQTFATPKPDDLTASLKLVAKTTAEGTISNSDVPAVTAEGINGSKTIKVVLTWAALAEGNTTFTVVPTVNFSSIIAHYSDTARA